MRNKLLGLLGLGLAASLAAGAALPARAQTAPPNVYRSLESGTPVHDAGQIRGRIVAVDYPAGEVTVRTGLRTRRVQVVPSTTIYRRGQYATLSDLRPGERVTIAAYEVSGRFVAQSIRL